MLIDVVYAQFIHKSSFVICLCCTLTISFSYVVGLAIRLLSFGMSWNLRFSNYQTFPLILQVCLVQDPSLNPNPTHIHELEIAIAIGSCKNWTIALGKKIWSRCPFVISHISIVSSYQCCMPLSVYNFLWWSVDLISSLFTSCSSVDESVDVVILSLCYTDCCLSC